MKLWHWFAVVLCPVYVTAQTLPARWNSIDATAFRADADRFLPLEMAKRHIPGLVIVLVADGKVAVARGYGMADVEAQRPVDPAHTVFGIASVSKVITATAALQLVEQGKLDLHRDVNDYLTRFQLPPARGTPITLHHLLTHTAGFEERLTGIIARHESELEPLAAYLAHSMPPRFAEPGRAISYSNHGMALAGLLVEETSGQSFEAYVAKRLLAPLHMVNSGFLRSAEMKRNAAVGYSFVDGRLQRASPDYPRTGPAGGFATTATDMGRFLIAHLESGEPVLGADTLRRMQSRQFTPHSGVSGWAYGFHEHVRRGTRGLMHTGGGIGSRAVIYLLPDQKVGFFLAYNLADRHDEGELQEVFTRRFLDAYFPELEETRSTVTDAGNDYRLEGEYVYIRRSRTTVEKTISIASHLRVRRNSANRHEVAGLGRHPVSLTPIAPLLFTRDDGKGHVAFDAVHGGQPHRMIVESMGFPGVYERLSWFSTVRVHATWLLCIVSVFIYSVGLALVALVRKWRSGVSRELVPTVVWVSAVASALNLCFVIGFPVAFLGDLRDGVPSFVYGLPDLAQALLMVPIVTTVLTCISVAGVLRTWRLSRCTAALRVKQTVSVGGLVLFVVFSVYWRILG